MQKPSHARLMVATAALAAFGVSLFGRGWPRDDRWLIFEHPLLRAGWPAARELLSSDYVAPVLGAETPIHEWRPVLSLTFLLQRATTGFALPPLRAVNLLLHAGVALLVLAALRRRLAPAAAAAGALVYAVLPVHAEVVAYLTSRSEELAAASVLGAWLLLGAPERPRARGIAAGALVYAAGALSKESALLFPLFLIVSDWTFAGRRPWDKERRPVYLALGLAAALVLAGRAAALPALAQGGVAYFAGTPLLSRLLTLAKFWIWDYARPAALGVGLCTDFSRPLIADARVDDLVAWAALLGLVAVFAAAARAVRRRESWGFWLIGPALFLLPTSHLLMDLDTLGAQRFLYMPALGLAAAAGALYARAATRAPRAAGAGLALVVLGLGLRASARAADWRDDEAFERAAVACNPVSAKARSGLGAVLLREGRADEGEADLLAAQQLDPGLYEAAFNLARLSYDRGDAAQARRRLALARASRPDSPSALALSALLDERAGRLKDATAELERAVAVNPRDPLVPYNLARVLELQRRPADAAKQLRAFLFLAPDDPDAPAARRWLRALEARGGGR